MSCLNRFGNTISTPPLLRDNSWSVGTDKHNWPIVVWENHFEKGTQNGFDKDHKIIWYKLPIGSRIIRYGKEIGHYSAPIGTKYDELSLPYRIETLIYNEYEVLKTTPVLISYRIVQKGIVAPGFGVVGGGVQFYHPNSTIAELVSVGVLRRLEEEEWSPNIEVFM